MQESCMSGFVRVAWSNPCFYSIERYILALVEEDIKDVEKFGDEKVMKEYISDAEKASLDKKIEMEYDYELSSEYERFKEGKEEGIQEGIRKGIRETAKAMLKNNIDMETISNCTGLSLNEIENLS